jgi:hypothetical protein
MFFESDVTLLLKPTHPTDRPQEWRRVLEEESECRKVTRLRDGANRELLLTSKPGVQRHDIMSPARESIVGFPNAPQVKI